MILLVEQSTDPPGERPYNWEWCGFGNHHVQREDLMADTPDLKVCEDCWCEYLHSRFGKFGERYIAAHEEEFLDWSGGDGSEDAKREFCIESDDWAEFVCN